MSDIDQKAAKKVRGFEILKTGRRIRGMSQLEVAHHFGITEKTYRCWEQGKNCVSYDDILTICEDVFRIPLSEVMQMAQYAN